MTSRKALAKKPSYETLEQRNLLAADIGLSSSFGDLNLNFQQADISFDYDTAIDANLDFQLSAGSLTNAISWSDGFASDFVSVSQNGLSGFGFASASGDFATASVDATVLGNSVSISGYAFASSGGGGSSSSSSSSSSFVSSSSYSSNFSFDQQVDRTATLNSDFSFDLKLTDHTFANFDFGLSSF